MSTLSRPLTNLLDGRLCLVTGANRGIGLATARGLADLGARVILHGRDRDALARATAVIDAALGRPSTETLVADLSSMTAVRNAAAEMRNRFDRLDVLINNAAVITRRRTLTVDGYERQFAVNHLAPFLLTNLLLDHLRAGTGGRIITVSSNAHYRGRIDLDDLQSSRRYSPGRAYRQSKLANVLFTRELARRFDGTGVTANALHPGVIATGLLARLAALPPSLAWLLRPVAGRPDQGARTSIFLASDPEGATTSGAYYEACRTREPSPAARDADLARRLWERSADLVGLPA